MKTAIIAITRGGAELGEQLLGLPDSTLFLPEKFKADFAERASVKHFDTPVAELVGTIFSHYPGLLFVMATGIVVRTVAPLLKDKTVDPAVVVMDEKGRFAISLLSGHLGGANELACMAAGITGGQAVITTATDVNDLPAIDLIAKEHRWVIENPDAIKTINAAIVNGGRVGIYDATGHLKGQLDGIPQFVFQPNAGACLAADVDARVIVDIALYEAPGALLLRPCTLVAGMGCNRHTTAQEIGEVFHRHLTSNGLSPLAVRGLATINLKEDEAGLLEFAEKSGLPISFYTAEELNTVGGIDPSDYLMKTIGAQGVCEPAAMLSAGTSRLLMKKVKDGNVTMAVAEALFTS
ncbi:MAG: cobalt-precorrin 5A hydrolase [Nitrospirota bacterium]|nr:cobalt-precorrin 5A hydrolase [Nitrospirota bacterium]